MMLFGCDECGEVITPGTTYVQVSKPGEDVEQIHYQCIVFPELLAKLRRGDISRVEITGITAPAMRESLGAHDMAPGR